MRTAKEMRRFNYHFAAKEIAYAENEIEKAARNGEFSVKFNILVMGTKGDNEVLKNMEKCITSALFEAGYVVIFMIDELAPQIHYYVKWGVLPETESTSSEMKRDDTL